MVKQIINIGVEGNDASGDPIREAFNKVNENFTELYAVFGRGGQITFSSLSDGPSEIFPESILIANAEADQFLSKTLEGDGIAIDNTDPTVLKLTVTASKLVNDPDPVLANNLDASNNRMFNLGNPDPQVAAYYGASINSFAINKGYADTNYVNITGDTMTGPLVVPAGQTGNGVARANETLLKAGGSSNQMQGPLLLYRDPADQDDPLIAATKGYVDSASYFSKVNLFVNTKGTDNQFQFPSDRQGRSSAYAFASINGACRYAENLVDTAPWSIGPYVKKITYNSGASSSTVVSADEVNGEVQLLITNNGNPSDARVGDNINPGQLIRGVLSDAYAFIVNVGEVSANTELYTVEYTGTNTFQIGEPLEWGNPIKNLQITIMIEAGDYYEHYPIRVPSNVTILGDEMRRVIIHPKFGRSSSYHVDTYFRRDTTFDTDLAITTENYGRHYLTDITKPLYTGTISNLGSYQNAASLIFKNKTFLIEEVIGFVNQTLDGLDYNQATCARDLGYIIDALAYDMAFASNFQSIKAAQAYFRGNEASVVLGAEKTATLDALAVLGNLLSTLVIGSNYELSINNNTLIIGNIIRDGISATPTIVWPNPSWIDGGYANAKKILQDNRQFIQYETLAYLNANYPTLNYNQNECIRDLGYIIDAVTYDLTYGGNSASIQAGSAYYLNNVLRVDPAELDPIYDTYGYLKQIVGYIINGTAFTPLQTSVPRYPDLPGSTSSATAAQSLIEVIRNIIQNNSPPITVNPSVQLQHPDASNNFDIIANNKATSITTVLDYINTNYFLYDSTLCKRDLGFIIDAVSDDLINGGFYKTLEAGNAFFKNASGIIVITTQLTKTLTAFDHLRSIMRSVIQNVQVTSYQQSYTGNVSQTIDQTLAYEVGTPTVINELFTFLEAIISQDSSFNPPKNNEDIDVFLMNNATTMRNISCQGHGGFMVVLDPLGQISTKSPYIENCSSFARSINRKHFAGGMFVDGFVGNLLATVTERVTSTQIIVSGLDYRAPLTPCSFYINGIRFEVDTITEYSLSGGTATINISQLTPDESSYTGSIIDLLSVATDIEFISPGYNSMCTSNFTQVNDLGYGVCAVNLGLVEAVSVFTYYAQVGYYVDSGAQLRAANGSCAYGAFALQANGASPLEVPNPVSTRYDMVIGATVYSPDDYYNGLDGTNVSGTGVDATFNIRVTKTSYIVYLNTGGSGYNNGDQINFIGTLFQGTVVTNDLLVTVTAVDGLGAITDFTYTGTIPTDAPFNIYYNTQYSLIFYVEALTSEYIPVNGSEIEIIQGTAPQVVANRYTMNNAQVVNDPAVPRPPTGTLYRIVLQSLGLTNTGTQGLLQAVPDGTKITIRQAGSIWLQGINRDTATRPSTALVLFQDPSYTYRVIGISNIAAYTGTYVWLNNTVTITCPGHGLVNGQTISVTFSNGSPSDPPRGLYEITLISTSQFSITSLVITYSEIDGNVSFSSNVNEGQTSLKEGFRVINSSVYYDAYLQPYQPKTIVVVSINGSTDTINCLSSNILTEDQPIKFTGSVGGITEGTTYYVKSIASSTSFTISAVSGGTTLDLSTYTGGTLTATNTTAGSDLITVADTSLLYEGQRITFSGVMQGGLFADTIYYVLPGFTSTQFQVSLTSGGSAVTLDTSVCSMKITPIPLYGTTDIVGSNYYTWGVVGSFKVAIRDLSDYDETRIASAISEGKPYKFGWAGKVHTITNYVPSTSSSIGIAYYELDNFTGTGLRHPIGLLEGGFKNAPTIRGVLPGNSGGNITINISTLRATNHDMLSIGTGGYSTSNFPNIIYGQPDITKNQAAEVVELGKGRVFYVTSDQDGNFRVGSFFKVDQGTGTVTFASSIAISNLDGLGFKRGVAIAEFSVDDTMYENATDIVPVQQTIRSYIDRRLGLTHTGAIVDTTRLIPGVRSGFMSLDGTLPMKANLNAGGFLVNNVGEPVSGSDAANKAYVDLYLKRSGGVRTGINSFQMTAIAYTSTTGTIVNPTGTGPYYATITNLSTSTSFLTTGSVVIATAGTGNLGNGVVTIFSIPSGTSINVSSPSPITAGTITNLYALTGHIDMNNNTIINVGPPVYANDVATKLYVDSGKTVQGLSGFTLPTPLAGNVTNNSLLVFNGTNFTWGSVAGDINITLANNTITSAIQPGKIVNSMVSSTAAIDQSKLNLTYSTAGTNITANTGICSFDNTYFTTVNGFVSIAANSLTKANLGSIPAQTVLGNNSSLPANPDTITFANVVQGGGGLYQSQFTSNGALIRTGSNAFGVIAYSTSGTVSDYGSLVQRDPSNGGFTATIINASTQLNIGGNKVFDNSGASPNQVLNLYTPQGITSLSTYSSGSTVTGSLAGNWTIGGSSTSGTLAGTWNATGNWTFSGASVTLGGASTTAMTLGSTSTVGTINGAWTLGASATLESTYAADIAEYYQGDKSYDVGTVVMIGGEFDVTLANGAGTTKVAGVISNNAAYIMNGACPGEKNLVALQGRVPCKVIGKIEKGDLMVVGIVPGVAMASADPKPGSIIGKALQNYDSDHVGMIEVMVGKH